jgi:hypothetical protein
VGLLDCPPRPQVCTYIQRRLSSCMKKHCQSSGEMFIYFTAIW